MAHSDIDSQSVLTDYHIILLVSPTLYDVCVDFEKLNLGLGSRCKQSYFQKCFYKQIHQRDYISG